MSAPRATGGNAPLAQIATRIWRERAALASRKWPAAEADQRLRPWIAMALLAGVPVDALPRAVADEIGSMCRVMIFCAGKGSPIERDKTIAEGGARVILAFELSPHDQWERELGEATNRAADRHAAQPTEANLAAWRDLAALSRALGVIVPWRAPSAGTHPESSDAHSASSPKRKAA